MRSSDEVRKRTVRMVIAAIKQSEVDKQTTLDDVGVVGLIQKEIKNRREAVEEANEPILSVIMKPRSRSWKNSCLRLCPLMSSVRWCRRRLPRLALPHPRTWARL